MLTKPLISPEDFLVMQNVTRQVIECIFQKEESFKRNFLASGWGWVKENYTLSRVHFSGSVARVTVEFNDGSTTDVYLELNDIYHWIIEESNI